MVKKKRNLKYKWYWSDDSFGKSTKLVVKTLLDYRNPSMFEEDERGNMEKINRKKAEAIYNQYTKAQALNNKGLSCGVCKEREGNEIHHVIPRSRGFYFLINPENCIPICRTCHNNIEHDLRYIEIYRRLQEEFLQTRKLFTTNDVIKFFKIDLKEI